MIYIEKAAGGCKVRIFKTKEFVKFARKEQIADADLCTSVARAERGLIDAQLGGGLIKQRIPRQGQGRSGGFRTIIAYRHRERSFFIYGFAKSEMDSVAGDELRALIKLAAGLLPLTDELIGEAIDANEIREVFCDA